MKKIILILMLVLAANIETQAQGAMVVQDPLNAQINGAIQTLNASSNALNKFLVDSKMLELATNGISQLQTISEIAKLVDDLACMTTEFNYYINLQQQYSCAKFLSFRLVNMNLSYSTEILTGVILSKNLFTMSSGERLNKLDMIKTVLEQTIKDMNDMVTTMRGTLRKSAFSKIVRKAYSGRASVNYSRKSYK